MYLWKNEELIKHAKEDDDLIVINNWNARVGGKEGKLVGEYVFEDTIFPQFIPCV